MQSLSIAKKESSCLVGVQQMLSREGRCCSAFNNVGGQHEMWLRQKVMMSRVLFVL